MLKSKRFSISLVAVGMLAMGVGYGIAQQAGETRPVELKLRLNQLLRERLETAKQRVAVMQAGYEAGQVPQEEVLNAHSDLLRAELGLAETKDQRIAILRRLVDKLAELEKHAKEMERVGQGHVGAVLSMQAARLDAEVALVREQLK